MCAAVILAPLSSLVTHAGPARADRNTTDELRLDHGRATGPAVHAGARRSVWHAIRSRFR